MGWGVGEFFNRIEWVGIQWTNEKEEACVRKVGLWGGERRKLYKRLRGRQRDVSVLKLGSLPGPAGSRNPGASVHIR